MWKRLWTWFQKHQRLEEFPVYRLINFTKPTKNHWISFDGGDNYHAMFTVRGEVRYGDYILVRLRSGRVGRYRVFSVHPDFSGKGDAKILAAAVGYWQEPTRMAPKPVKPIKGLLGDGTRWVRSDTGELAHLPSGFTKSASEFWKILARNEACHRHTSRIDAAGDMRTGPEL